MQIHEKIKEIITAHKNKVEIIQWSVISSITSLVYSEYIIKMKQKQYPVRRILVPSINNVKSLLQPDGNFIQLLSTKLIDRIITNELFIKYKDAPEFVLFNDDNINSLKLIFDLYMINNIYHRIPESISKKFDLSNPNQQTMIQDDNIDLFNNIPINERQLDYIIEETILNLLTLIPTMKKNIELPEHATNIYMTSDEIVTIGNEYALCPIHFNENVIHNDCVMNTLSNVTNTRFTEMEWQAKSLFKNQDHVIYSIDTSIFNSFSLTTLLGIVDE